MHHCLRGMDAPAALYASRDVTYDAVACDFVEAEAGRRQVERYTGMEKNSYGKKETMKRVSQ